MRSPGVGAAVNVTNRPGYDYQPSFSPDGGTMYFTSQRDGQTDIYRYDVASGIGRTILRATQGTAIYFARRDTSGWWVHELDGAHDQSVAKLPSRRDDFFAVTDDGHLIAANGNQLLFYRRAEEKWIELATFSEPGLQHITRIAFCPSGNCIAVVGDEPAPPRP